MKCVYFLYNNGEIIYIGKTKDISGRLYSHKKGNWSVPPKVFDIVVCYPIYSQYERTVIEKKLIEDFKPRLNGLKIEHYVPSLPEMIDDFEKVNW